MTVETASTPQEPTFDGHFGCACGKVRVDVLQPKSSSFVAPTAAICQCTDCYQFASSMSQFRKDKCPGSSDKADALMACNGVDMRQIYKSDAVKLTGEENLRALKLKEDSPAVRYFSTCCGTPLMMDYTMAPFFLVFQHTIDTTKKGAAFQPITPPLVLNHKSAPPDSPATPEGVAVKDGVSLGFISHAVMRAIVGMISGKKTSPIAEQLERVLVATGLESLRTKQDQI